MPIAKQHEIRFDEQKHIYWRVFEDGHEEQYTSVTQLLKKHGLTTDYTGVPAETLQRAAERGKLIHKEIEDYVTDGKLGFTDELDDFIAICKGNGYKPLQSEFIVYNDRYKIAGTVDLMGVLLEGEFFIADNKTTAKLNQEATAWQLAIYAFLSDRALLFEKHIAFHLLPDHESKGVELKQVPQEDVFDLLETELKGEIYKRPAQLEIVGQDKIVTLQQAIEFHKRQKEIAEAQLEEIKQGLIKAMETNRVKTFENDLLKITYVAPQTKTTIDSAKLKKELPEIAEQYSKKSNVKASVRITLKEDK